MPQDELAFTASGDEDRRAVAWFFGAERAPDLPAGILIVGNDGASFTGGEANQPLTVQQRMARKTPHRGDHAQIFFEVMTPDQFAVGGIQADQVSLSAE